MIDTTPAWHAMRTDESREVEAALRAAGFEQADAYRYNSALIRVRVIDPRFEGMKSVQRYDIVEPFIDQLPERLQADIMTLLVIAPSEAVRVPPSMRETVRNLEFENPSPSEL